MLYLYHYEKNPDLFSMLCCISMHFCKSQCAEECKFFIEGKPSYAECIVFYIWGFH